MSTKNTAVIAVIISILVAVSQAGAADLKVATVDMGKVMKSFNETKSAEALLEKQIEEFDAEQKEMLVDRDKLRKEFESARESARDKALSEKERESKMDAAEEKLNSLRDSEMKIRERMNQRQKEIADQKTRMQRRIVGRLRDIVGKYATEKGYSLVMDSAALSLSGVETVVYSKENLDITDEVLKIVNIGVPERAPVPEKPEKSSALEKAEKAASPDKKK